MTWIPLFILLLVKSKLFICSKLIKAVHVPILIRSSWCYHGIYVVHISRIKQKTFVTIIRNTKAFKTVIRTTLKFNIAFILFLRVEGKTVLTVYEVRRLLQPFSVLLSL